MKSLILVLLLPQLVFANKLIERFKNELYPTYRPCFDANKISYKSYDIHYCFAKGETDELYVISPGRNESGLKYTEIGDDIRKKKKASILIIDHLNQGFSTHVVPGTQKVHIDDFNEYFESTELIISKILNENADLKKVNAVAHSMGSYIIFEVAKRGKIHFENLFLSSPMLGISTRGIPRPLATWLSSFLSDIGFAKSYAFFQGPYNPKPFSLDNYNTTSKDRYELAQFIYREHPEIKSAGSTFGWVNQVLKFTSKVTENLEALDKTNVLIFQSGKDRVVDNQSQNIVCDQLKNCQLIHSPNAYHDFINEVDEIRGIMYSKIGL
ncbi:alpha/beta fold hydrolase [Bacteriovorax sp. Seq25_V]|uniref:alpha/beta fold hydrolase n=1 Tax=Bacteriovorax sp. Seq25_V TaxID=1201288 RepID=UPI00038A02DC|nr:alpha/beta hydrolase [Bacteriovorax sp. Seq25_V]EQC43912.1 alpha/beta hydrolase family protein [Bacteriovorax sp. Seq25_V]